MKLLLQLALLAASATHVEAETPEWLWLACGKGKGSCGDTVDLQDKATTLHEVRCCSSEAVSGWVHYNDASCGGVWAEADLLGLDESSTVKQCFHTSTYVEAVAICEKNNAEVCSKEIVEAGCTRGSGCGHDADLIWTSDAAPERAPLVALSPQDEKEDDDWMWISCGNPGKCGPISEYQAQAKEKHEVRCCSPHPNAGWVKNSGCGVYGESDLFDSADGKLKCFHEATYNEALQICADNYGYVCSKEEVEGACTKSSGCGHDADLIWTSTDAAAPEPPVFPNQDDVDPEDWLWLACGRGKHDCGIGMDIQVQAKETHELRCCSPLPISGWKKNGGDCGFWHEADLLGYEGELKDRPQCFHDVTYAEAQHICAYNGGHVCTREQIESGCAKGSGCGHDGDLLWTGDAAPAYEREDLPYQDPVGPDDWLYLACGKGGNNCGPTEDVSAQAKEKHEVRCCSDYPLQGWKRTTSCVNWHESDLLSLDGTADTCFHASTYAEAQAVCKANGGYVCTHEQVKSGCARGSGCGHDADMIWTSTGPAPGRTPLPFTRVADDTHLFIACGKGVSGCGGADNSLGVAKANEKHEVRCCSPYPVPGWIKRDGCGIYQESDLTSADGTQFDKCFHASTYAEAQDICEANWGRVCSMSEVLDGCVRGSGCGHDGDLIWTSTPANDEAIAAYKVKRTQATSISGVCTSNTKGGKISGDPHFTTFDMLKYDCQGHGEFVIAMAKGSDPLAIHGQFVPTRTTSEKPTITRAVAIKVVEEVPIIHVTAPPAKINGQCPFTFTMGKEETVIATEDIISYVNENYNGTVEAFSNGKNIIFTYPSVGARVQITGGGGGNRCVLNTNLCLTPENHGGAENIMGLLGSPDGNQENDWMARDGSTVPLPAICSVSPKTNSEVKECHKARKTQGHGWCMDHWCIGHADNSLWSAESHAMYNHCDNHEPDGLFDNTDEIDPAIADACAQAADPEGCEIDCTIAVEDGEDMHACVDAILEEDKEADIVDGLDDVDPSEALDGWDGPIQNTDTAEIELPPVITVSDEEGPNPSCPVCKSRGWGDPHIITFDGVAYDVHVIGELTFLKSLTTDFEIQARTEIVENHPKGPAVTTAVVVHEDSTKGLPIVQVSLARPTTGASVSIANCPVQVFVDGQYRDVKSGTGVDDVTIQVARNRIVLEYPTTNLRLDIQVRTWRNTCHFSVNYILSDCRCDETLVGILGQPGDGPLNDWHKHDGTPVEIPTSRKDRRTKKAYDYSTTWCLEDADASHFTYEGSNNFDTFDKCNPEQYDDTIDEIIENASPELITNCTIEGEVDYGCILECAIMGEEACDDYKVVIENTETADILPPADTGDEPEDTGDEPEDTGDEPEDTGDEPEDTGDEPEDTGDEPEDTGDEPEDTGDEPEEDPTDTTPTDTDGIPDDEPSESVGTHGDPHFKSWLGEHFEYHGQCDMILTKDQNFGDGIGLEVQIRTKLVRFWSYIKRAAIRIGDEILEIEGNSDPEDKDTHYWFNFEYAPAVKTIGGFPLAISYNGMNKRTFEIDLNSKFPGQKIVISSFREFIRVDFQHATAESFGNAVGMMGDFKTGNLLARDGVREINDFLEFGNEWQLLPADDMLFHDKSEPQFPKRCIVPEDPQGQRRRRLGESTITVEEAETACAKVAGDALDIKDCVYDILATQDLDMVGAF